MSWLAIPNDLAEGLIVAQTTAFRIRSIIFGFEGIFGRGTFPFGAESCAPPGRDLVLFGGTILKNAMQSYESKLSHFFINHCYIKTIRLRPWAPLLPDWCFSHAFPSRITPAQNAVKTVC